MSIGTIIQDEVLGMKWLNRLIGTLLSFLGLNADSRIGASVQFFLYDTIKIMVLLGFLILVISYIQSYFPPERSRRILGRFHGIGANIVGALLGTVTPFCSCSSIPDLLPDGRSRLAGATHEHLRVEGRRGVCGAGIDCRGGRRQPDRTPPP